MLQALAAYARSVQLKDQPGFGTRAVHWAVRVDAQAVFRGLDDLRIGGRARPFEGAPKLHPGELLRGGSARPHCQFLVESADLVLRASALDEKAEKQRALFLEMLDQASATFPMLAVSRAFLLDQASTETARRAFIESGGRATDHVVVTVDDQNPLTSELWKPWWRAWYDNAYGHRPEGAAALDLCDGRRTVPVQSHPMLSGLKPVGGARTGDSLVSFDKASFVSYGLQRSANAAMSAESAALVAGALQHLLGQAFLLGGSAVVCWGDQGAGSPVAPLFGGFDDPEGQRYHLLVLSGRHGRVRIRSYRQGAISALRHRIDLWQRDLELSEVASPTLPDLMATFYRDPKAEMRACHAGWLLDCVLDGSALPAALLDLALDRTAAEAAQAVDPPALRVAFLKAFLRRRGFPAPSRLDNTLQHPAYRFGRLLGALGKMHYVALSGQRSPVLRAIPLALCRPAKALLKLRAAVGRQAVRAPGAAQQVGRIAETLRIPDRWQRDEQALIILGYHQQRWEKTP